METPTETPTPTETIVPLPPEPTAGSTPGWDEVYTVIAPGSDVGTEVRFRYEMDAGDVMVSMLLFGVLVLGVIQLIMGYWKK